MTHTICTAEGCPYFGRYCRIHKDEKPKKAARGIVSPLQKWYAKKIRECKWICEECGQNCYSTSSQYQHAVQAHLLPKSLFPSVATHELNYACLGAACGCHGKYDSNWANASKMKIWGPSLQIIYLLIPLLWPEEYRKLPDVIADGYEDLSRRLIEAGQLKGREAYVRNVYLNLKRDTN